MFPLTGPVDNFLAAAYVAAIGHQLTETRNKSCSDILIPQAAHLLNQCPQCESIFQTLLSRTPLVATGY